MPHELTANQKNCLEVSSLVLHSNELFLDQIVTCNENWIVYESWWQPAQQLDWEEALKSFPKPNLHQEKGHGHCLVVCCWSDSLQLSESQQNHYIWEVCWANCWDAPKTAVPTANNGQQKGPSSSLWQCPITWCTTSASKVEQTELLDFASPIVYSPDLLPANWLPLLWASWQLFAGKMLPQPAGCRKCFPRVDRILKHWFFCCRNKCISRWQKYVDYYHVPILINKYVFEPSYTDWKFRVQKPQLLLHQPSLFFRLLYMSAKLKNIFSLYLSSTCTALWFNICLHYKVITPDKSSYHSSPYSWSPSSKSPISQLPSFLVTSICSLDLLVCFCFVYPLVCACVCVLIPHINQIIWYLSFCLTYFT